MKRSARRRAGFLGAVVIACAPRPPHDVLVTGRDYAFEAPDTVPSGPVVFRYRNAGKVRHEMIVLRLTEGASSSAVVDAMKADSGTLALREPGVGVLFADPGESNKLGIAMDLIAGRKYLLVCRFRDEKDKPPHDTMGMYKLVVAH